MDWNGDGLEDIIVGDRDGFINYFKRLSDMTLTEEQDVLSGGHPINVGNNSAPAVVDWNEDGLLDLIIGRMDPYLEGSILYYENIGETGSPLFDGYEYISCGSETIQLYLSYPQVFDLNSDGLKDLLVGETSGLLYYYENTGTNESPLFENYFNLESCGEPIDHNNALRPCFNDWNEDGIEDILASDYSGCIYLYLAEPLGIIEPAETTEQDCSGFFSVYGNPVVAILSVNIHLEDPENVELILYSIDGRLVDIFFNNNCSSGETSLDMDLSRVQQGIYFLAGKTGTSVQTEKIVLIR